MAPPALTKRCKERGERSGDDGLSRAMIGRKQTWSLPCFSRLLLLRMKGHEGHNESRRCIAAEKTIALCQDNPRTGVGGPQRRAEPGWPAADNQDIGLRR